VEITVYDVAGRRVRTLVDANVVDRHGLREDEVRADPPIILHEKAVIVSIKLARRVDVDIATTREAEKKAGQAIDDAMEEIQHGDEGPMEEAGRKIDETVEEAKDELEEAKEG